MVQSRRTFSCRQLIGVLRAVTQLLQLPAGGGRVGEGVELQGEEPRGAQPVLRDPVAGERLARERIDRRGGGAVRDLGPAEVPGALGVRGHEGGSRDAALLAVPLLGGEEVELVLDDRAPEGPAEVVRAQRLLRLAGLLEEVVLRGQGVISSEVVRAAVERVGAAAGDDVHLGSGGPSELGAVAVAVDLELVDRVHGRDRPGWCGWSRRRCCWHHPRSTGWRCRSIAAHRDVRAGQQPLVLDVEAVRRADARA